MKDLSLYLAGGSHSNWQKHFWKEFEGLLIIYDPSLHDLHNAKEYTSWDLLHIKRADIVVAVMESSNPSGYGLALEIGYAHALGKTILLIDSRSPNDESFRRYFDMARCCATIEFHNVESALAYLKKFIGQEGQ